jgi:hypothetical protein
VLASATENRKPIRRRHDPATRSLLFDREPAAFAAVTLTERAMSGVAPDDFAFLMDWPFQAAMHPLSWSALFTDAMMLSLTCSETYQLDKVCFKGSDDQVLELFAFLDGHGVRQWTFQKFGTDCDELFLSAT